MPQRHLPIRGPNNLFPFPLPLPHPHHPLLLLLPLPTPHLPTQSIKRRRPRRHRTLQPARRPRRRRRHHLRHLPRPLPLRFRILGRRRRGRKLAVAEPRRRGEHRPDGENQIDEEEGAEQDCDGEAGLGLFAVALEGGFDGGAAAFGEVPGGARLGVPGVGGVGGGLGVDADGVEGDEGGVDGGGEEGVEDVADVHDCFAEEEEEGDDGDDDVVVCYAVFC